MVVVLLYLKPANILYICETNRPSFYSALSSSYFLYMYCYVIGLYVYIYIYLHFRRDTVLSKNFFSQTRVASERFYWPGGNRFAFQMSWSPKRRDSETLATAWTLRLSTCMASKHKKYTYTYTQTHNTHTDLFLSRHTRFH